MSDQGRTRLSTRAAVRAGFEINGSWPPPGYLGRSSTKVIMDTDDKRMLLADHMADFRRWNYESLAAEIDRTRQEHDCLRHTEGTFTDGTEYQTEFNVFWDAKKGRDIRVCGDLTIVPQRPMLGFIPVFTSDVTDSFIMLRDGTFVDE